MPFYKNMTETQAKPRLVFFQYKYERLAPFLLMHQREHVDCLSQFFDVTIIQNDCDYREVCDTYEPDLVMFESGVPFGSCKRPAVQNLRACPQVLKVGFLHADGFGEGRTGFLSDMDHWGIETFFTIATTAADHTPAIAGRLFVWPNFVNPKLYRDYGQTKSIDVLFTGNKNTLYPWRRRIVGMVPTHYPSVICSHPGYSPQKTSDRIIVGESYARMLNSAWLVPACGTVAKEIVRKHFEVPACRSCLVTERSAALEVAGFVDMKNCVFADENDVVEKLGYLLEHHEELQAIIDAGHELVHSRHTMKNRDQVLQWYRLNKNLESNKKIIQTNPFEPLQIVNSSSGRETMHIHSNGELVSLLREANSLLWRGEYARAEHRYMQCVTYYRYMPEPLLGLTLCSLFQGAPKAAMKFILKPLEATLAEYKAIDPDPVEWAYFIVVLLCLGKLREAAKRSREFQWLHHPELDRVRWIVNVLLTHTPMRFVTPNEPRPYRLTVHQLPSRDVKEWVDHLVTTLRICGQEELAQEVDRLTSPEPRVANGGEAVAAGHVSGPFVDEAELRRESLRKSPFVFFRTDASGFFSRRLLYRNTALRLRQAAKIILRGAVGILEWLVPRSKDDFANAIHAPRVGD